MECRNQLILDFSPATRKAHPETSRLAEKQITETGRRKSHCRIILDCLRRNNGSTSKELAKITFLRHDQIWRRRKDLEENGYIKIEGERDGYGIWWIK